MAHVEGVNRQQSTLFPARLDDWIGPDHPARVIDAFVDGLDLAALGFARVLADRTGRPPYRPGDLLKLYVYGYLNRIRSSRRLEQEARRNVEVLWLIRSVSPCFKTIANFRKDHAAAIVESCRAFVGFCREQKLYGGALLAIDGTRIEAVASRKSVLTPASLATAMASVDRRIAGYLAALDDADRAEAEAEEAAGGPAGDVQAALAALRARRDALRRERETLASQGLKQKVVGEEDARLMRTARHGYQVAYNAQTAVDGKHGLIAAFDLVSEGNDQNQLHPMAERARQALQAETVTVVADTGYSSGAQGRLCADAKITAIVPRAETVNPRHKDHFRREAFAYDAENDTWRCPAGETLSCGRVSRTQRKKHYWTTACTGCSLKGQCTDAKRRTIVRDFDEDFREAMHRRSLDDPGWMKRRRELAEHPFGTMKWLMGTPRFLVRGRTKAKSELALVVLGFNLKRAMSILGTQTLIALLKPAPA